MMVKRFIKEQKAQGILETAIIVPIVLIMILVILQFAIITAVHLGTNYAAYKAARAVHISMHNASRFGQKPRSALKDARNAANAVGLVFDTLGWSIHPTKVELKKYTRSKRGSRAGTPAQAVIPPDTDIWVIVTKKVILVIPIPVPSWLMKKKYIFGDGYLRWINLRSSCLVHTPHEGENI